jgi:hypothetical protein
MMNLGDFANAIGATVLSSVAYAPKIEVNHVYVGDRMSDLLDQATASTLLVTHLANMHLIRAAELLDVPGICLLDGIEPDVEVIETAAENGKVLMVSPLGMHETCQALRHFGLVPKGEAAA